MVLSDLWHLAVLDGPTDKRQLNNCSHESYVCTASPGAPFGPTSPFRPWYPVFPGDPASPRLPLSPFCPGGP